jgi:hypothetical protein
MNPEIIPVSRVKVDWPTLRKNVSQATGLRPSDRIAQSPVKFTEAAEYLLFAAYLYLDITEDDPHRVLLNLPRECLDFLHYSFLIACERSIIEDLREKTRAHYTMTDVGRGYCVLGTGPLSVWYDAVVLNLTHPQLALKGMGPTRVLFNKLMLFFEKEGLQALFRDTAKKQLPDKTFLLEHKK